MHNVQTKTQNRQTL